MKHIVCYSGGASSTLCAFLVAERYGTEDLILFNNYMPTEPSEVHENHKRLSQAIGVPITYGKNRLDQFDIAKREGTFRSEKGFNCVKYMKILDGDDFYQSLDDDFMLYFGFSPDEERRIHNQKTKSPYKSDFPLTWDIAKSRSLEYYGFELDLSCYEYMPHANCVGCLRGSYNHWYMTYALYPDIYLKAMDTELTIGENILNISLLELVPFYEWLLGKGIPPSEKYPRGTFDSFVYQYFRAKGVKGDLFSAY